jgi:hypothetical protein
MPFLSYKGDQITALYTDETSKRAMEEPFMYISKEQYELVCRDPAVCYVDKEVFRVREVTERAKNVARFEQELARMRASHAGQMGILNHNRYTYYPTAELLSSMNTCVMLEEEMMVVVSLEDSSLCGVKHSYKEVQAVLKAYMRKRDNLVRDEQKLRDSKKY